MSARVTSSKVKRVVPLAEGRNPCPSETLCALATIFAAGFLRLLSAREKALDLTPEAERQCASAVNSPEIAEAEPRSRKASS